MLYEVITALRLEHRSAAHRQRERRHLEGELLEVGVVLLELGQQALAQVLDRLVTPRVEVIDVEEAGEIGGDRYGGGEP